MSVRKIRKSWWIDIRHKDERVRKRSPENSRAGAAAYEALVRHRIARGEPLEGTESLLGQPSKALKDFVPEWFETYVRTNNKPTEQRSKDVTFRIHLLPWFGSYRLSEITNIEIEQYKSAKQKSGLSAKTINNHLCALMKCLRCANDWGLLVSLPKMSLLRVPPQPFDFLTPIESAKLLRGSEEPQWREMILVALRTGMRLGELIGLDWSAVDFRRRIITVRQSIVYGKVSSPKSNRIRHIPMANEVLEILWLRREEQGLVFPRPDGQPLAYNTTDLAIKRHCKRAGLRPIGWHVLRHTFASQLATEGVSMRIIQEFLGHSTIQMTGRYAHLAPSAFQNTIEVLQVAEDREMLKFGQQVGNADEILAVMIR